MATLTSELFAIDSANVYTLITKFIPRNYEDEANIQTLTTQVNGCLYFTALQRHCGWVGFNEIESTKAEVIISYIFYSGENKPHMWWNYFEKKLTIAFENIDKDEGDQVYSNRMKTRILNDKAKGKF